MNYLNERKNSGQFTNDWIEVEELYVKKLWHQLTLKVKELVNRPEMRQGSLLIEMYEKFISDFDHRINQLSLAEICLPIVRQYCQSVSQQAGIEFLLKQREKVKSEPEAMILCDTTLGVIYLEQKNFEQAKKLVEEVDVELQKLDQVTKIHANFYELSSNYYRTIGNHSEYYKNALRYLGCIKLDELSRDEQQERAAYLSLAAILGDGVYNFGELLMHPILSSLNGSQNQWLVDLLYAFNRGDLDKFEQLKPVWSQLADLKAAEVTMRQKICLLCLMEMAFTRPATKKALLFNEIAAKTKLPENEVELLVMRALSLGLVKGSIDQIDTRVYLTWVQPRVLDLSQIKTMRSRLDQWSSEVNKMIGQVHSNAHEILT